MSERKSEKYFFYRIFITFLFIGLSSADMTNLCSPSCNCTLINNTDLTMICDPTISLTQLPTLQPNTLQASVTHLRLGSSIANTRGPLNIFPTNICSYPNVQILDLSFNNISGLLNTTELACLGSQLLQIDLSFNSINNIDKNLFQANNKLQTINLSSNNLINMPVIDGNYFVNFPTTIVSMNFSFNQITLVDLWPIFVRTRNPMVIDMSYNLIDDYTNVVPISLAQFTQTPDSRYFYLNNNRLTYFSDLLFEQYGACSTTNPTSAAYFIVGMSNVLLTNNNLICDCQSYNLITYIQNSINDFPQINNGTALLTQATCSAPAASSVQPYLSTDFSVLNNCNNYTLPNISGRLCSLNANDTAVTLTPPTYWPSTTTTSQYSTNSNTNSNTQSSTGSSVASSWYIILGVVLGLAVILGIIICICYLCRDKFFAKKYRSKLLNHARIDGNNGNNSYEQIIRHSATSTEKNLKLNGIKPRRASMTTSTDGFDEQEKGTHRLSNGGFHSDLKPPSPDQQSSKNGDQPDQETQTNFPPIRSKPPTGRPLSTCASQPKENKNIPRERKFSLPASTDVATNTINVVKGIPISFAPPKPPPTNMNDTAPDTSTSELSVTSIPLTPSKRAKILPPVKNGICDDSTNNHLLNTSAGALVTSQRQRRRSALWFRKQNSNMISPLSPRPHSEVTQKTIFDYDGSFDEDRPAIPTIESLTNKPLKPLRTVPLLNISVVPAWVDENNDQT